MTEIKHIRVWSLGKISAAICFILGVIFVIFGEMFILASTMMGRPLFEISMLDAGSFTLASVIAILAITVYALTGFIWGAAIAVMYNVSADWFGGIEIDTDIE